MLLHCAAAAAAAGPQSSTSRRFGGLIPGPVWSKCPRPRYGTPQCVDAYL